MPLSAKGEKIKAAMQRQYGKERGTSVFYASKNKGTISGVDSRSDATTHEYLDAVRRGDAAALEQHPFRRSVR